MAIQYYSAQYVSIYFAIDVEIIVTKTRNLIHNYKCNCCHKNVTANDKLPRGVTYGDNVNSIALSIFSNA